MAPFRFDYNADQIDALFAERAEEWRKTRFQQIRKATMQQSMALRACAWREVGAWEEKRANFAASQANEAGAFAGYASVFGVVDSTGDVIMPGAFAGWLQKRGASGVKMLWQHQAAEPIGVWTRIVEDRRGLKVEGQLDLSVARACEALSLMRSGTVDGLSIGFKTKRATLDKQNDLRKLLEVNLWEISIVTFPALELARIESVKRREAGAPVTIDDLMVQLARLKAHRAAQNFENKPRLFARRLFARTIERRYAPDQPRVPAGSREGGRWTGGGGGGGAAPDAGRRAPADQTFRKKILPARHKFISHHDRNAILVANALGAASNCEWDEFWSGLQQIVSIVHPNSRWKPRPSGRGGKRGRPEAGSR